MSPWVTWLAIGLGGAIVLLALAVVALRFMPVETFSYEQYRAEQESGNLLGLFSPATRSLESAVFG